MMTAGCPSCAAPMERRAFVRKPNGEVDLDLCFTCHAIWFDPFESTQLAPGSVIDLFKLIHENNDQHTRPLADSTRCPRCRERLLLTHDIQRTNKITYYRCPAGHGRLTTFFQFLREKNFVRSLTAPEVAQLKANVKQVRCSGCGAPVNLETESACAYCRAPISILDADAVKRTLDELSAAQQRARRPDPVAIVDGLLEGKRFENRMARIERGAPTPLPIAWTFDTSDAVDLVTEALDFLMS
jgi:hypothetical protein